MTAKLVEFSIVRRGKTQRHAGDLAGRTTQDRRATAPGVDAKAARTSRIEFTTEPHNLAAAVPNGQRADDIISVLPSPTHAGRPRPNRISARKY